MSLTEELPLSAIRQYELSAGLDRTAKGRYSDFLVLTLMMSKRAWGIDSSLAIEEIKAMEGMGSSSQTKSEEPLIGEHLRGLWHKHFFTPAPFTIAKRHTGASEYLEGAPQGGRVGLEAHPT
jgi:hypothetical protein